MNDSYIDRAQEILELKLNDMISNDDISDAIDDIVKKYPDQNEQVHEIMNEIGYMSGYQKAASRRTADVSIADLQKKISALPKALAISLAALLLSVSPGSTAWAKEMSGVKPETKIVQNQDTGKFRVHIVKNGDNFEKIAKQYKVTVSELQKANPNVDSRRLRIGQKLNVPEENKNIVFDSGEYGVYLVRPGDTLTSIAKKLGVSVDHLKKLNGLSDEQANNLKVKQKIKTFDFERMARAFIYVETYQIPEGKRDTAIGDNSEALGCLQFHVGAFQDGAKAAGISVTTNTPGVGEWWSGDDRTNREKSVKAFEGLLKKYKPLSVEEILKKAHWNSKASVSKYLDAYNNDSGVGIPLK